jgi:hypothetical protein
MTNIFGLFYNDCVNTNSMLNSASVHSGSQRFHFLGMLFQQRVLPLTLAKSKRYWSGRLRDR